MASGRAGDINEIILKPDNAHTILAGCFKDRWKPLFYVWSDVNHFLTLQSPFGSITISLAFITDSCTK